MSALRERMIEDMQLRGLSERTQESYLQAVRQLAKYYHKPPDRIDEEELRQYFLYLKNGRQVSRNTCTIALCGIKFFYVHTLKRTWHMLEFIRPNKEHKLPVVLSLEEVSQILRCVHHEHYRVCLTTIYACGLRLLEGVRLQLKGAVTSQVKDIDSQRKMLHICQGKGGKDHENLEPMLEGAKKNVAAIGKDETYFQGKQLTADSNYHSFNSLNVCQDEKIDAYIPDIQFRDGVHGRQRTGAKPSPFNASDFSFDASKQVYLCPQGKELTCHAHSQRNRYRTYDVYHARLQDCAACPVKSHCLSKSTASRRYLSIQVDTQPSNLIDQMKAKIDTHQGKRIYARRLGIVEPVFANICVHKHMNRFTLRSKCKVDVQWRLFALVHNIGKIHTFGALA